MLTLDEGSLFRKVSASFDHGLFVMEDSESTAAHDDWNAHSEKAHLDGDSLYLSVQSSVDGQVEISIVKGGDSRDVDLGSLKPYFAGVVRIGSGKIRFHDPDDVVDLTMSVRAGAVRVDAFVDDLRWPGKLVVLLTDLGSSLT